MTTITAPAGVRCGNRKAHGNDTVKHTNANSVRLCFQGFDEPSVEELAMWEDQAANEQAAEAANERFFETRPSGYAGHPDDYAGSPEEAMDRMRSSIMDMAPERPSLFPSRPVATAPAPAAAAAPTATDPQMKFLAALVAERPSQTVVDLSAPLTKAAASKAITALKDLPVEEAAVAEGGDVPAGHYAVETEAGLRFYKVSIGGEGKWEGYRFVEAQASDDYHPVRGAVRREALDAIAEDPKAASIRYGREIGRCGRCNRTLTHEDSRAMGIGPECAKKEGWA